MLKINSYDLCTCGSGNKFKFCCKSEIKKATKEISWDTYPEKFVIGRILKNETFKDFYESERSKINYPLYWAEDTSLAEGIDFRVTQCQNLNREMEYAVIHLRSVPVLTERDAGMIAHEMLHLLLQKEGFMGVVATKPQYGYLASALSSTLEDPVVNKRLQSFGFDTSGEYTIEIEDTKRQLSGTNEPTDEEIRLRWIFNFASKLIDRETFSEEDDFVEWFTSRYPNIAREGLKINQIVQDVGYGTPDQKKEALNRIISIFDKGKRYFRVV